MGDTCADSCESRLQDKRQDPNPGCAARAKAAKAGLVSAVRAKGAEKATSPNNPSGGPTTRIGEYTYNK
eukprot:1050032-Alexandrium_andersonii.AAC.1